MCPLNPTNVLFIICVKKDYVKEWGGKKSLRRLEQKITT